MKHSESILTNYSKAIIEDNFIKIKTSYWQFWKSPYEVYPYPEYENKLYIKQSNTYCWLSKFIDEDFSKLNAGCLETIIILLSEFFANDTSACNIGEGFPSWRGCLKSITRLSAKQVPGLSSFTKKEVFGRLSPTPVPDLSSFTEEEPSGPPLPDNGTS